MQGIGAVLRRNADFVTGAALWTRRVVMTGAVNRTSWTCGSFADFVAGAVLRGPQSANFVAGTALCEP